jgi:hypothetical protein
LEPPKAAVGSGGVPDPPEEPLLLLEQPTPQTIKAKAIKVRVIRTTGVAVEDRRLFLGTIITA